MLTREFFARDTLVVARGLVGTVLEVQAAGCARTTGRIVEVEAYLGEADPASHAGRGRTPRSAIMYGPPGLAYVYLIYGVHHCLNVVTGRRGCAGAVLIRALEPVRGRDLMSARRGLPPGRARDRDLCVGPGRLCRALGIDLSWNGLPVAARLRAPASAAGRIRLYRGEMPRGGVVATPRIGIRHAADRPWRFIDPDSSCLSA